VKVGQYFVTRATVLTANYRGACWGLRNATPYRKPYFTHTASEQVYRLNALFEIRDGTPPAEMITTTGGDNVSTQR
jgi:hypothetical protein